MNVTLRQLRAFSEVANSGSFTEAAMRLYVTPSALSGLIKELEQALGVRLLHRSTRRLQLSEVGSEFLPLAVRILQDLEHAMSAVTELKALRTGTVRVGAPQLMACTVMPQLIGAFTRKHPQLQVTLVDSATDAVLPRVRSGEVDFAVGAERENVPDIEAHPLFAMPFVAVVRPHHPFASRRRLTWQEFAEQPVISLAGDYTRVLNRALSAAGCAGQLRPSTEVAYLTTALSMVSAGLGVTTCQPYAQSLIRLYGLKTRPLHEPRISRRFELFTRKERKLSPAAQAFADFVVTQLAKLPGRD
jgi:DNA-binding transcriptional LysR family regulator